MRQTNGRPIVENYNLKAYAENVLFDDKSQQYYQQLMNRSVLSLDIEEVKLKDVFARNSIIEDQFTEAALQAAETDQIRLSQISTLTLAAISPEINICGPNEETAPLCFPNMNCENMVAPTKLYCSTTIIEERGRQLRDAINSGADIITFSELSLPLPAEPLLPSKDLTDFFSASYEEQVREHYSRVAEQIIKSSGLALKQISQERQRPILIFFGSAHCAITRYNIGVLKFGTDGHQTTISRSFTNINKADKIIDRKEVGPNATYLKKYPARRAYEAARVPTDSVFRVYNTFFGKIVTMICSDVLDANQCLRIVKHNLRKEALPLARIYLVLVPSYNHSTDLLKACQDLSKEAMVNVLVVNATEAKNPTSMSLDPRLMPETKLFFCGHEIKNGGLSMCEKLDESTTELSLFKLNRVEQDDFVKSYGPGN